MSHNEKYLYYGDSVPEEITIVLLCTTSFLLCTTVLRLDFYNIKPSHMDSFCLTHAQVLSYFFIVLIQLGESSELINFGLFSHENRNKTSLTSL